MKTLVWAIDPDETHLDPSGVTDLKGWAEALGLKVHPIHILPVAKLTGDKAEGVRKLNEARLRAIDYLARIGASWAEDPSILVAPTGARAEAVDRLLKFAHGESAEVIAVSSHGRSGPSRMVMGSFAEALLACSDLPILFLSHGAPDSKPVSESKAQPSHRVLFATDFSEASKQAFETMTDYCAKNHADLVLFHQIGITPMLGASLSAAGAFVALPDDYFEEQRAWAEKEAAACVQAAKVHGVAVRPVIVEEYGETSRLILEAARREGAEMIALSSRSGPIDRMILGSVGRGVFRPHDIPVWVFGPHYGRREEGGAHAGAS